ncbi:hypothetical protein R6Q57_026625 [Mikania cordata]
MIDAPRGYFAEAAVMARNRKKSGVTHVFLHDVDRRVEKSYAEEFLCRKYLKMVLGGCGILRYRQRGMSLEIAFVRR